MEPQEAKPIVEPAKKNTGNLITISIMAIFVLLCLGSVVFLYNQNQSLKKELVKYLPTPTPNSVETPVPTTDPIANWKKYTDTKGKFSFKHPLNINVTEIKGTIYGGNEFQITEREIVNEKDVVGLTQNSQTLLIDGHKAYVTECPSGCEEGGREPNVLLDIYGNPTLQLIFYGHTPLSETQLQILSTFKFLDTKNTYKSSLYDLSFSYPDSWKIKTKILQQGESLIETGKFDELAKDGKSEIIDLVKNDWTLRISLKPRVEQLGGFGPISNLDDYKKVNTLGRNILRTKIENGILPFTTNHPEPYPFTILFQRKVGEINPPNWPKADSENSYIPLFTINSPSEKSNIGIVIYSNNLLKNNIENKKIDTKILNEIDQILSTLSFTN